MVPVTGPVDYTVALWSEYPWWPYRYDFFISQAPAIGREVTTPTVSFIFPISSPQTYHPTNLTPPFRFKPSEVPLYFRKFYWYENGETKSITRDELKMAWHILGQLRRSDMDLVVSLNTACDFGLESPISTVAFHAACEQAYSLREPLERWTFRNSTLIARLASHLNDIADLEYAGIVPTSWHRYECEMTFETLATLDANIAHTDYLFRASRLILEQGVYVEPEWKAFESQVRAAIQGMEAFRMVEGSKPNPTFRVRQRLKCVTPIILS